MKQFRFLDWKVYKDSQKLFSSLLQIVKKLPREYRYELGSQLLRSGSSIILNVAEGSGKQSEKELNRFIETALGSSYETLANIDILKSNNFITEEGFLAIQETIADVCSQLGGFKKKLDL
ncbi:MAG: four helix bundle protein [Candidatus Zambryskibacteria bacterium]|nr:four helix bundle protein [Candidatus Zambryskibacteria bacterium]